MLAIQEAAVSAAEERPKLVAQRSRHRIPAFRLHRPETPRDAVAIYAASGGPAAYMAGGIDLVAELKSGLRLCDLVHLGRLPDWTSIVERIDSILIGPGVTHQQFADSRIVGAAYPSLCETWSRLANNRIRIKGTLGGNLMARNPTYDFQIAAIAVGAQLQFVGPDLVAGQLPAERLSELPRGTLLTSLRLPRVKWVGFAIQTEWKPIVAFALSLRGEPAGVTGRLVVGCGYAAPAVVDVHLENGPFDCDRQMTAAEVADRLCTSLPAPITDWRASSEYRSQVLRVLVRREIERMILEEAR